MILLPITLISEFGQQKITLAQVESHVHVAWRSLACGRQLNKYLKQKQRSNNVISE